MNLETEILSVLNKLNEQDRRLVFLFVKLLESQRAEGKTAADRLSWKYISQLFSSETASELEEAINQSCERIDENGWA